jgi:hypothetical protein
MFWEELFLRRRVTDSLLVRSLAATFEITPDGVRVVDSLLALDGAVGDDVKLLIERRPTRGDFTLQVRIYIRDPELERRARQHDTSVALVKRFRELVGTDCLMSDDSPSGVSWLKVGSGGILTSVILDADRLENDELIVVTDNAVTAS